MNWFGKAGALGGAIVALGLLVPTAAQAAECGNLGSAAVYKTVTTPAQNEVTKTVVVVVTPAVPEVPAKPGTPAVEEVSHIERQLVKAAYDETIIIKEAWTETVPGKWWNFSPNKSKKPFAGPPAFPTDPRGTWQGPHTKGGPGKDKVGTFQQGKGHGSWFHRAASTTIEHPAKTKVVHHDAVYKDVKVIDVPAQEATPPTPAVPGVPAVTKTETKVVKAAVPASSKRVLVKAAVPAGEACVSNTPVAKKTVQVDSPPATLAYTGSKTEPLLFWSVILMLGGVASMAFGRRLARNTN